MRGFVKESDLDLAEVEFPGITRFFRECDPMPPTFLDLLRAFLDQNRSSLAISK